MSNINKPVPGADQFYPLNEIPIGTPYSEVNYGQSLTQYSQRLTRDLPIYSTENIPTKCDHPEAVSTFDDQGCRIQEPDLRCKFQFSIL